MKRVRNVECGVRSWEANREIGVPGEANREIGGPRMAHVGEIVAEFGLSADTWRRLADRAMEDIRAGRRPAFVVVRVNGQRVFDRASVAAYLERGDEECGVRSAECGDAVLESGRRLRKKFGK